MSLYNVEIFQPDFTYRSSYQSEDVSYEFDYLSLSTCKIKLLQIAVERGDYIRITSGSSKICGIVIGVSESDTSTTVEYKDMLTLFDVNVYTDLAKLSVDTCAIEQWLADIITDTFIENSDNLQNIYGMQVKITSETTGSKYFGLEDSINNLYEVLITALVKHDIILTTDFDIQNKALEVRIGKNMADTKVIEAGLPNVIKREFVIKNGEEAINKLVVINEEEPTQVMAYYRSTDGTISATVSERKRIVPVVFDTVTITVDTDSTFEDASYQEALDKLVAEEYDNLIEITVLPDDDMVKPLDMTIGQKATVIYKGIQYSTILTGIKIDKQITLIFGSIRTELTKKLKRRNRNAKYYA